MRHSKTFAKRRTRGRPHAMRVRNVTIEHHTLREYGLVVDDLIDIGHEPDSGSAARPPCLVVIEEKNQCLRADVQQRVMLAAMRWIDADSAVDEQEGARLVRQTMEILI